jgi:large subunit ribosomal protein L25
MDLSVETREKFGKATKTLRRAGLIPAELYGHGIKNEHLSVPEKDFIKAFKEAGTSTILYLCVDSGSSASGGKAMADKTANKQERKPAIIHDVVRDPLTGTVSHVDFYAVKMDEIITAHIPLEFVNESPAVKEKGAIINKSMTEIEVESLPQDLPHAFKIDLSLLDDLDKSIYVRDIVVPKGVKILIEEDTAIATATPPLAEEKIEEAPPVDVSAVKVEGEEKKAERDTEKAGDSN